MKWQLAGGGVLLMGRLPPYAATQRTAESFGTGADPCGCFGSQLRREYDGICKGSRVTRRRAT